MTKPDQPTTRRCPTCRRADRVRVRLPRYSCEYHHDGRTHTIAVTDLDVWQCTDPQCAEIVLDREALRTLDRACRDQLGLLQPEMIGEQREKLRLSPHDLARAL